ncbi:helix-turn-helix domain-containing protein [Saliterribacillus persicus]|uniref:Helix-turn-helix protein n=1 Tax=Saliterribacillus persicus TaxID=930114 RepID=A0A368YET5_9BACI|nr:helix-turn-helix transcriptional regulator [Saliterribacillus persicus]RCW77387.1 helix-turn-helix protein [Saliterribacillus persicus]
MQDFGSLIRYHRKKKGYTLKQVSQETSYSVSYISQIENGRHSSSVVVLETLANVLEAPELLRVEEDFTKIDQALDTWYQAMLNKNLPEVERLAEKLSSYLPKPFYTTLNTKYELYHFRYLLVTDKITEAMHIFPEFKEHSLGASGLYQKLARKIIGIYFVKLNQFSTALQYFEEISTETNTLSQEDPELNYYLALVYSRLEKIMDSIESVNKALLYYRSLNQHNNTLACEVLVCINYIIAENYVTAEKKLFNLLEAYQQSKPSFLKESFITHNIGYVSLRLKKYDQAVEYLKKAIKTKTTDQEKSSSYYLIAETYAWEGYAKLALTFIDICESIKENPKYQYKAFILKNIILGKTTTKPFIEKLENEILPYFKQIDDQTEIEDISKMLGDIYYNARIYKMAADYRKTKKQVHYLENLQLKYNNEGR